MPDYVEIWHNNGNVFRILSRHAMMNPSVSDFKPGDFRNSGRHMSGQSTVPVPWHAWRTQSAWLYSCALQADVTPQPSWHRCWSSRAGVKNCLCTLRSLALYLLRRVFFTKTDILHLFLDNANIFIEWYHQPVRCCHLHPHHKIDRCVGIHICPNLITCRSFSSTSRPCSEQL